MDKRKIGINGIAGRVGKFTAYELFRGGAIIGAVNDLASTDEIVGALSHRDGVHGDLDWVVEKIDEVHIGIGNQVIEVYHEKDPATILWGDEIIAVDECTGFFTERTAAERHFAGGSCLETILISAPGKGDMKTLVMGVNHTAYNPNDARDNVISNASCTTKAMAVPIQVLYDLGANLHYVDMVTVHAATNTQKPLDFMSTYGVLDTIQTASSGASVALTKLFPELDGKVRCFAMRVPTRDGSFVKMEIQAESDNLEAEYLNNRFREAVNDPRYCGRLSVFEGMEIASHDLIGNVASSVITLSKTRSTEVHRGHPRYPENMISDVSLVIGYDNERGPSKDLAMLTQYVMQPNQGG